MHQGRAHSLTLPFDVATVVSGGRAVDAGRRAVQSADGAVIGYATPTAPTTLTTA